MWENRARAALAEAFLAALKEDQLPWRKCWNAAPVSFSTGRPYRGINNLMLSFVAQRNGYQDTRWLTYKQAQNNGWQVRKGEKSTRVEFWSYYDTKLKKMLDRSEVSQIQKTQPERMKDLRLAAYTYNVFNAEQIDGIPAQEPKKGPDLSAFPRDRFLENLGVGFREGGDRAFYSPGLDIITMPLAQTFENCYGYVATLLHEAGHATGAPSRLGRDMLGGFGSPEYAKEELRAEIASAFTAQALQLPYAEDDLAAGTNEHKAYIQSWISILENNPDELFAAIKDADKIADYLLEHGQLLELARGTDQSVDRSSRPSIELHGFSCDDIAYYAETTVDGEPQRCMMREQAGQLYFMARTADHTGIRYNLDGEQTEEYRKFEFAQQQETTEQSFEEDCPEM